MLMFLGSGKNHPPKNHRGQYISRIPINFVNRKERIQRIKYSLYMQKQTPDSGQRWNIQESALTALRFIVWGFRERRGISIFYLFSWYFSKCGLITSKISVLYHKCIVFLGSFTTVPWGLLKVWCRLMSIKGMNDNGSQEEEHVGWRSPWWFI